MKQTKHPVYILSKGRWESRMTSRTLEEIGADYRIVIEQQEYDKYAAVIDPKKILVLPFSNLGLGGIPARNWVWEHSISEGHERHWIMDDNIRYFYRLHENTKLRVRSMAGFRVCEDYSDRFENVYMSGLNYHFFTPSFVGKEPAYYNTRIYSCILLSNKIKHRWRVLEWDAIPAPYNEDTDLSLQIMKDGGCTILLNSFTVGKAASGQVAGGNTSEVYKYGGQEFDHRYKFTASLNKAHPDVVEMTSKWGRIHHHVDYTGFQLHNKMILKQGCEVPTYNDQYGLKLVKLSDSSDINSVYTDSSLSEMKGSYGN